MGQFSWFTQDTNHRIVNGEEHTIYMTDNKGTYYTEHCYEGYGVFGNKDYYELLAEMNGYPADRHKGIDLAFGNGVYPMGDNPNILHPSLTELEPKYMGGVPESDPNQGFLMDEDDYWEDEFNSHDYDGDF